MGYSVCIIDVFAKGLQAAEMHSLDGWYDLFKTKYADVGWLEKDAKTKL